MTLNDTLLITLEIFGPYVVKKKHFFYLPPSLPCPTRHCICMFNTNVLFDKCIAKEVVSFLGHSQLTKTYV